METLTNEIAAEERARAKEKLDEIAAQKKAMEDLYDAQIKQADAWEKKVEKLAKEEKAIDKAVRDAKVGMAQSGLSLITEIAGESSAIGKAAAIAQTTISGIQSVQEAFKSGVANAPMMAATGGAYGFIQAGLAGAFSAVQLAKLGAPSSPLDVPDVTTNIPAPQMMSGAFDISGGVAPEATKAYVVTDEMSNSQNQLANIRRRATI